jgi:hypothetical protein
VNTDLRKSQEKAQTIAKDEVFTSMFFQTTNSDYKIIVRFPSIEYCVPSRNFTFIKTLSPGEMTELLDSNFADWHLWAVSELQQVPQFREYLAKVEKAGDLSLQEKQAVELHLKQRKEEFSPPKGLVLRKTVSKVRGTVEKLRIDTNRSAQFN